MHLYHGDLPSKGGEVEVVVPASGKQRLNGLRRFLGRLGRRWVTRASASKKPTVAYDLWSVTYDEERENLLVILDESLFARLLGGVGLRGKCVVDVGCGTGRHWDKILSQRPGELVGYDVSRGMLAQLKSKYPNATTHLTASHALALTRDQSCDIIVSTLAISHFESIEATFREWTRVLRFGGEILLTDLHPAVARVAGTTFSYGEQIIHVKAYVRSLEVLEAAAAQNGLELMALEEVVIDESMRPYYERAHMSRLFDRIKGLPVIFGMHLRKRRPWASTRE